MLRFLMIATLAGLAWGYSSFGAGPLNGSSWEVKVRRRGLFSLAHHDTLVFEKGRFISSDQLGRGFLPSSYKAEGGLAAFSGLSDAWQASQDNERGDSLHWRGRVEGDRIAGTVTRVRPDGDVRSYVFDGRRKA